MLEEKVRYILRNENLNETDRRKALEALQKIGEYLK